MKTTYKALPNSQGQISVIMPADKAQEYINIAIAKLGSGVELKGFRKGHAPKQLVVDKIGLGRIQQESLDQALQTGYMVAIQEHKLHPISQPSISLKKFNLKPTGEIDGNLEYELVVDLMPKIELGDYTKIKISDKKIIDEKIEVTEEEINKVLEHLRRQKSVMTDVKRPVKNEDWVEVSFSGMINKVVQEKLGSKNHPLVIGSGAMVPGFEEAIIGMEIDKSKVTPIIFPKDYFAKEVAGKKAEFTITVHKIKEIKLPEINIDFAKSFGHDSIQQLKEAIKNQLHFEKENRHQSQIDSLVLDEAKKLLKVNIPTGLVTQEIHRMIDRSKESIEKQGLDFNRYLESIKKTHDDLHKDYEPQAKANIEVGFLLGEVINREKLNPDDKEAPQKALAKLNEYATNK